MVSVLYYISWEIAETSEYTVKLKSVMYAVYS